MKTIKQICVFIVLGAFYTLLEYYLKSNALTVYITNNLISIHIAILTIMLTVYSFMLPMMLKLAKFIDLTNTDEEIKLALLEQLCNVVIVLFLVILINSPLIDEIITYVSSVLLIASFLFGMWQIKDVGCTVVDVYKELKNTIEN